MSEGSETARKRTKGSKPKRGWESVSVVRGRVSLGNGKTKMNVERVVVKSLVSGYCFGSQKTL